MTTRIPLTALLIALASVEMAHGLSTGTQLTRTNEHHFPFIAIHAVRDGENYRTFHVSYRAPAELYFSDSIGAVLQVQAGDEVIARSSISGTRPTAWWTGSERTGMRPVEFSFTVRQEHLAKSRFSITHGQPDFSRVDTYWFYLKDFVHDE